MADSVADLLVRIDATTELLRRELKNGEAALNNFQRTTETAAAKVHGAIEKSSEIAIKALAALGVAWSVETLVEYGRKALETAAGLGTLAQQVGVTTKTLQTLQFAALQTGVAQDQLQSGLAAFTRKLGEAQQGNTAAITSFEKMGIAIRDKMTGAARTGDDAIHDLADRVKNAATVNEKATISYEAFNKTGQRLIPVLNAGSAGLDAFAEKAERVGFILDDSLIEAADHTEAKLSALGGTLERQMARAVVALSPTILALAEAIERSLPAITEFLNRFLPDDLKGPERLKNELKYLQIEIDRLTEVTSRPDQSIMRRIFGENTDDMSLRFLLEKRRLLMNAVPRAESHAAASAGVPAISPVADDQRAADIRIKTEKLIADAITGTIKKQLEAKTAAEFLTLAYSHYTAAEVDAMQATGKWTPELEALRKALGRIDAEKLAGDLAKFTDQLHRAADARQRLAEATGLGAAAERQAANENAVAAAERDGAERAAAVRADNLTKEGQARLSITNELVRGMAEQTAANANMARATLDGTLAVREAARAEFQHQAQLRLGRAATVELTQVMQAYDAEQRSALQLEQARILSATKLKLAQTSAVNAIRQAQAGNFTTNDFDKERAVRAQERLNEASEKFNGLASKGAAEWLKMQGAIDESEIKTKQLEARFGEARNVAGDFGSLLDHMASGSMDSILAAFDQLNQSMEALDKVGGSFAEKMEAVGSALLHSAGAGNGLANLLGKAMGRSEQQNKNAQIGGQIGTAVFGPGLGTFVGNLIGGLFGPSKSVGPIAQAYGAVDFTTNRLRIGSTASDNKGDPSTVANMLTSVGATLQTVLDRYAGRYLGSHNGAGVAIGQDTRGFYAGTNDQVANHAGTLAHYATADEAAAEAFKIAFTTADISGMSEDVKAFITKVVGRPIAEMMSELDRFDQYQAFLHPEDLDDVGTALKTIGENARQATIFADQYGYSIEEVAAAQVAAVQKLDDSLHKSVTADFNNASGKSYLNDVQSLKDNRDAQLRRAGELHDTSVVPTINRTFVLAAQALVNSSGLVGDAFQDLLANFPELTGQITEATAAARSAADILSERTDLETQLLTLQDNQTELLRRQRDALDPSNRALFDQIQALKRQKDATDAAAASQQKFTDAARSVSEFLTSFRNSIHDYLNQQAASDLSSLDPFAKQGRAQADFTAQLAKARGGDKDALGSITDYADRLLQSTQELNGHGTQFAAVERLVQTSLAGLPDQVDVQQLILAELQHQGVAVPAAINLNGQNLSALFQTLDVNGDGQLSQLEIIGANTGATATAATRFSTVLSALTTDQGFPVLRQIRDLLTFGSYSTMEGNGAITGRYTGANDTIPEQQLTMLQRIALATEISAQTAVVVARAQGYDLGRTYGGGSTPTKNLATNVAALIRTGLDTNLTASGELNGIFTTGTEEQKRLLAALYRSYGQPERVPPGYAAGTDFHPGGFAVVGEHGPELLNLPRGAAVYTAADTTRLLRSAANFNGGGAAGGDNVIVALRAQTIALSADMKTLHGKFDSLCDEMAADRRERMANPR